MSAEATHCAHCRETAKLLKCCSLKSKLSDLTLQAHVDITCLYACLTVVPEPAGELQLNWSTVGTAIFIAESAQAMTGMAAAVQRAVSAVNSATLAVLSKSS